MTELYGAAPKTLIVSNNMIEADDLIEMLTFQGLGPVAHARELNDAQLILDRSSDSLRLLMFGLSLHLHEAKTFLETFDMSGKALLVIDGPMDFSQMEGAGVLLRPFSTKDVLAALKRLGLSG
jgi:alpha-glucuronidase